MFFSFKDTIYGQCDSDIEVGARKGNIAAEISVRRNLKSCDNFNPIRDYVSPVALIKGLVSRPGRYMGFSLYHVLLVPQTFKYNHLRYPKAKCPNFSIYSGTFLSHPPLKMLHVVFPSLFYPDNPTE